MYNICLEYFGNHTNTNFVENCYILTLLSKQDILILSWFFLIRGCGWWGLPDRISRIRRLRTLRQLPVNERLHPATSHSRVERIGSPLRSDMRLLRGRKAKSLLPKRQTLFPKQGGAKRLFKTRQIETVTTRGLREGLLRWPHHARREGGLDGIPMDGAAQVRHRWVRKTRNLAENTDSVSVFDSLFSRLLEDEMWRDLDQQPVHPNSRSLRRPGETVSNFTLILHLNCR